MKSYTPLKTAAIIVLVKLYQNQGISSEYVMVDFICIGLLDLCGARTDNNKKKIMKNSCKHWDWNPGPSAYEANALSVKLLALINIVHLKVTAFFLSLLHNLFNYFVWLRITDEVQYPKCAYGP